MALTITPCKCENVRNTRTVTLNIPECCDYMILCEEEFKTIRDGLYREHFEKADPTVEDKLRLAYDKFRLACITFDNAEVVECA